MEPAFAIRFGSTVQRRLNQIARKRLESINEIQFVDSETGAHLLTIGGENAKILLQESQLLKTLAETWATVNPSVLVVPIGQFPADRRLLFINILKGKPVGQINNYGEIRYFPLSEIEEQDLQAAVNKIPPHLLASDRDYYVNQEREEVIFDTMRYLMISDDLIRNILTLEKRDFHHNPKSEYNVEDHIEDLLENHKKWLYLTAKSKLESYYKDEVKAELAFEKRMHKLNHQSGSYGNRNTMDPLEKYEPIEVEITGDMTLQEYERWLRSKYFKKDPLEEKSFHLESLYNENRRALRNRANQTRYVYYNPNNTATRKNKNKNKKNKSGKGSGAGAGPNAWS